MRTVPASKPSFAPDSREDQALDARGESCWTLVRDRTRQPWPLPTVCYVISIAASRLASAAALPID